SVAFSPDGRRLVSGSDDWTIRVWDAETGELVIGPLQGHLGRFSSVAFSPNGEMIDSGAISKNILEAFVESRIAVWDAETGEMVVKPLKWGDKAVKLIAFDGERVMFVSQAADFGIWDIKTGQVVTRSSGRISFDDIQVSDAETGKIVAGPLNGHKDRVLSACFSSDGRQIVSGSSDSTVRVWNAEMNDLVSEPLEIHDRNPGPVTFLHDGTRIIAISKFHIEACDAETGQVITRSSEHMYLGFSGILNISPDGKRLIFMSFTSIHVSDVETGDIVVGPFKGYTDHVLSACFSPDSRRIVSGSRDSTARVWNAETGELVVGPLQGHTGPVKSVAFSPDGRRLVSGSDDWTIRVWDAET
ncbi:hypothetical protein M408DRAFT_58014, partial [Serendipita vermifera MAFF 305830]